MWVGRVVKRPGCETRVVLSRFRWAMGIRQLKSSCALFLRSMGGLSDDKQRFSILIGGGKIERCYVRWC